MKAIDPSQLASDVVRKSQNVSYTVSLLRAPDRQGLVDCNRQLRAELREDITR